MIKVFSFSFAPSGNSRTKVTRSNVVEVRCLPEGAVFSNDGQYIYVGNYIDRDVTILRVDGDQIVNTGKSFALPGHPASMRGRTR